MGMLIARSRENPDQYVEAMTGYTTQGPDSSSVKRHARSYYSLERLLIELQNTNLCFEVASLKELLQTLKCRLASNSLL